MNFLLATGFGEIIEILSKDVCSNDSIVFILFEIFFLEEGMLCILRMTGIQMFLFFFSKIKLIRTSDNKSRIILACFEYYCHNNFFKQLCNEKIIQRCIILG